jgi:hypothetical protein
MCAEWRYGIRFELARHPSRGLCSFRRVGQGFMVRHTTQEMRQPVKHDVAGGNERLDDLKRVIPLVDPAQDATNVLVCPVVRPLRIRRDHRSRINRRLAFGHDHLLR